MILVCLNCHKDLPFLVKGCWIGCRRIGGAQFSDDEYECGFENQKVSLSSFFAYDFVFCVVSVCFLWTLSFDDTSVVSEGLSFMMDGKEWETFFNDLVDCPVSDSGRHWLQNNLFHVISGLDVMVLDELNWMG